MTRDDELKRALNKWEAPKPSADLDRRVFDSCEPAPVPPTMNSRSNMCSQRVMPEAAHDTQMPKAEVMLPIQCICSGSKFAPRMR